MKARPACFLGLLLLSMGGFVHGQEREIFKHRWRSKADNGTGGRSYEFKITINDSSKPKKDANKVEDVGYFFESPALLEAQSQSGLFFGRKEMHLRLHFRADTLEHRWCCMYGSWRASGRPDLACMLIYDTAGESLDRRTIKYRYQLEKGELVQLQLWAMGEKGKVASVKTEFGQSGPQTFVTEAGEQGPVEFEANRGKVFLVRFADKPEIKQIDRLPSSFEHDDFLKLTKEVISDRDREEEVPEAP